MKTFLPRKKRRCTFCYRETAITKALEALIGGIRLRTFNDLEGVKAQIAPKTCAID